jgi:DNA-binding CsgD family transcriptional regulator/PAS domain-containing protein
MSLDDALFELIDTIGEAALDPDLWPIALTRLADVIGAEQVAMGSLDLRTRTFASMAPRTDPADLASYTDYWAFHNPLWIRSMAVAAGQTYSLDALFGREAFTKTPIYNEWWRQARWGLTLIGANLLIDDGFSALVCIDKGPSKDEIADTHVRAFEVAVQHIHRAVKIQRRICRLDLERDAASDQFDSLPHGVMLVNSEARVVFANPAARALLAAGDGLVLQGGCLASAGGGLLPCLIAGCAARSKLGGSRSRGGDLEITRGSGRSPLQVTVAPLGAAGRLPDMPWLGLRTPVAIVTVTDPDVERRRLETYLREAFGLTPAESSLAAEIAKGDGRRAAAQRRGVALSTARAQLSSIFEKTGTRRQAELVRLVHDVVARFQHPEAGRGMP